MVQYILMDIEGTTTSISFVHDILFPYSRKALPQFVMSRAGDPEVRRQLDLTATLHQQETGGRLKDDQAVVETLQKWIDEDRKAPPLKALQGMIWKDGYEAGAFRSDIYPDVPVCLKSWKKAGLKLGIYSSGSVPAQKLLFAHTPAGDLTPMFSNYFDTSSGGKKEAGSYRTIARALAVPADSVVFLSDIPDELAAAAQAGMRPIHIVRPGTCPHPGYMQARDFTQVGPLLQSLQ